jgi:hypothetical protein
MNSGKVEITGKDGDKKVKSFIDKRQIQHKHMMEHLIFGRPGRRLSWYTLISKKEVWETS